MGNLHSPPEDNGNSTVNKPIKILGIYFTYDWQKFQELNFENINKSIKKSVNLWNWGNLTLLGRIQIIKTYAMPKFMFRATQIPLTEDIIKEINTVLFRSIFDWLLQGGRVKNAARGNVDKSTKNHVDEKVFRWEKRGHGKLFWISTSRTMAALSC